MTIRDATKADLPTIVEIYNATIPGGTATADTKPVSVVSRLSWFQDHDPIHRPIWVKENEEGKIIGWLSFQSFYGRPAYRGTTELSIYVASEYRRQGLGKQLLQRAVDQSQKLEIHTLLGFIFAHNEASLRLFDQFSFREWGYLPRVAELDGVERDLVILGRRMR
ncbi:MAG: N-acetyltransferase family protein [Spirulinaceae cyanobacterium]